MQTVHKLEEIGIEKLSRVLVCMPHPDDEAVFISGFLYKLAVANIPVRLLTFTKGEASTLHYGLVPSDDLVKAREKELAKSLSLLRIRNYELYDFGDGLLEEEENEISKTLEEEIQAFQPSHLVTLEPDGIYGHPDHIALSGFVSKYQSPERRILYATVSSNFILPAAVKMAKKETVKPIAPDYVLKLNLADIAHKVQSLRAHRSQLRISLIHPKTIIFFLRNRMLVNEYFAYKR